MNFHQIFFNNNIMRYNNCPIFKNCDEILKNNNILILETIY